MGEIIKKLNLQEKYVVDSNGKDKFIGWEKEFKDCLNKGYISINEKQTSFLYSYKSYKFRRIYRFIMQINYNQRIYFLSNLLFIQKLF